MFGRKREKVEREDPMEIEFQLRLKEQRTRERAKAIKGLLLELMLHKAKEGRYSGGVKFEDIQEDAARTLRLAANIHDAVAQVTDPDGVLK